MTFYAFRLLSSEQQLRYVLTRGIFLISCKETILYYLPDSGRGFFVELGVDIEQTHFFVLRSFHTNGPLETYTQAVSLPVL